MDKSESKSRDIIGESSEYERQIILPEITSKGQEILHSSKVLIVGTGGLGSICSLYLTTSGIGEIGIIDGDKIERSNLHRQILFGEADIGHLKTAVTKAQLQKRNPAISVLEYEGVLSTSNCLLIVASYDVLIDCTDDLGVRYMLSDAAIALGKPLIHGTALRWEGQITTLCYKGSPCYRCLFPSPTLKQTSHTEGISPFASGIIGLLQSLECVKILLNFDIEDLMVQRMLIVDMSKNQFIMAKIRGKKEGCPACGEGAKGIDLSNYDYAKFIATTNN